MHRESERDTSQSGFAKNEYLSFMFLQLFTTP
jgi:hypothetical protein